MADPLLVSHRKPKRKPASFQRPILFFLRNMRSKSTHFGWYFTGSQKETDRFRFGNPPDRLPSYRAEKSALQTFSRRDLEPERRERAARIDIDFDGRRA